MECRRREAWRRSMVVNIWSARWFPVHPVTGSGSRSQLSIFTHSLLAVSGPVQLAALSIHTLSSCCVRAVQLAALSIHTLSPCCVRACTARSSQYSHTLFLLCPGLYSSQLSVFTLGLRIRSKTVFEYSVHCPSRIFEYYSFAAIHKAIKFKYLKRVTYEPM